MAYYTRSRARSEHKSAGVLPFSLHEGSVLVLLGAEPCKTGPGGKFWRIMWRDFGGAREAADADSEATAAREFAEETLGLFGTCGVNPQSVELAAGAMAARLHAPGRAVKVVHALKRGSYHFFITQQPFVSPLMFRLASQQNAATGAVPGAEKSAFAWVPLRALLECVAVAAPRYILETQAHVCGSPDTPPKQKGGRRRFQLHPCFASSLRMAQEQGLEELLARAEELPLPQAPPLLLPAAVPAEPAASALGRGSGPAGAPAVESAVAAAAAATAASGPREAAAAAAGIAAEAVLARGDGDGEEEEEEEEEEEADGWGGCQEGGCGCALHDSLSYWLAQEEVAAALRGSGTSQSTATEAAAGPAPASSSQQHSPALGGGWGVPGCGLAAAPAASGASLAPAASLDAASSLRQSQQAAMAAALGQVVHQIEVNSHQCKQQQQQRHRLSRKKRQTLRRRQQRAQQQQAQAQAQAMAGEAAAAEAAAAAAGAGAGAAGRGTEVSSVKLLAQSMEGGQQQQWRLCLRVAEGAQVAGPGSPRAALLLPLPPSSPPHWQHAQRELESAFQPRMRLGKRLRLCVAET